MFQHDLSIFIGRFQLLHEGHLALLHRALLLAPTCVVVLGSARQARTVRNPFTWQERADMIREALPEADRARVHFVPVLDYYDTPRWSQAVQHAVAPWAAQAKSVVLVGHFKDATSQYLSTFPDWQLDAAPLHGDVHSTGLRAPYFEQGAQAALTHVPTSTQSFLRNWANTTEFERLAREWRLLQHERAQWASAPYPPVFVTVDALVRCAGHVLLIQRARAPGEGLWALPGGFWEQHESLYDAAVRELCEETRLAVTPDVLHAAFQGVKVFDHPQRSTRGRVITHVHCFDLPFSHLPEVQADDDAASAQWVTMSQVVELREQFHDDHAHVLDCFGWGPVV